MSLPVLVFGYLRGQSLQNFAQQFFLFLFVLGSAFVEDTQKRGNHPLTHCSFDTIELQFQTLSQRLGSNRSDLPSFLYPLCHAHCSLHEGFCVEGQDLRVFEEREADEVVARGVGTEGVHEDTREDP